MCGAAIVSLKKKPRPGQARRTLDRAIGVSFWPRQEPKKHVRVVTLCHSQLASGVMANRRQRTR